MVMSETVTVSFDVKIGENPMWAGIIDEGMGAPFVNGVTKTLPSGEVVDSEAAMSGGYYEPGVETGTGVKKEVETMLQSLLPSYIEEEFSNGTDGSDTAQFATNLAKSRWTIAADEVADNPDEYEAGRQVAESVYVELNISPPIAEVKERMIERAAQEVSSKIQEAFR